jgi:hypothetical protein
MVLVWLPATILLYVSVMKATIAKVIIVLPLPIHAQKSTVVLVGVVRLVLMAISASATQDIRYKTMSARSPPQVTHVRMSYVLATVSALLHTTIPPFVTAALVITLMVINVWKIKLVLQLVQALHAVTMVLAWLLATIRPYVYVTKVSAVMVITV